MALTRLAHSIIAEHFKSLPKVLAVDATLGNGHDTEFLLRQNFARVIGFDIQAQAINATKTRLESAQLTGFKLVKDGHQNMDFYLKETIQCCMFNFGYLPKADKNITTRADTSLTAINSAIKLLGDDGLISLLCYPGHEQGNIETKAIQQALGTLTSNMIIEQHLSQQPNDQAPILYILRNR